MLERELIRWRSLKVDPPSRLRGAWVVLHGDDAPIACETLAEALTVRETFYGASPALVRFLPGEAAAADSFTLSVDDGPAAFVGLIAGARTSAHFIARPCRIDFDALDSWLDVAAVVELALPIVEVASDGAAIYGAFIAPRVPGGGPRCAALLRARPGPAAALLGRGFLADQALRLADRGRSLRLGGAG